MEMKKMKKIEKIEKKNSLKDTIGEVVFLAFIWLLFSVIASAFQTMAIDHEEGFTCETDMYIEYVLYTDLFCEVKPNE